MTYTVPPLIRPLTETDLPAARLLWSTSPGVELSNGDELPELSAYLQRNPATSQAALIGEQLAGAVLAGHDGRRGFLYHLAVAPPYRGAGLGRALVMKSLAVLKTEGVTRVLILVDGDNAEGDAFWRSCGWEELEAVRPMGIDL